MFSDPQEDRKTQNLPLFQHYHCIIYCTIYSSHSLVLLQETNYNKITPNALGEEIKSF